MLLPVNPSIRLPARPGDNELDQLGAIKEPRPEAVALALGLHDFDEISRSGGLVDLFQSARIFRERDDCVIGPVNDKNGDLRPR